MAPATLDATTNGTNARFENSKSSNSIASTTAASGVPNVADMPAAAPHASRILRSEGVTRIACPMSDPNAPPVTMIGPSAPNGPPVPMATAADSGLATAAGGAMRLWRVRIDSIASGIPWPRITGDQRASNDTTSAPAAASTKRMGPGWKFSNDGSVQPHWWKSTTLVISPMRCSRIHAAPPPMTPSAAAMAERKAVRRARARRETTEVLATTLLSWHDINGEGQAYRC